MTAAPIRRYERRVRRNQRAWLRLYFTDRLARDIYRRWLDQISEAL